MTTPPYNTSSARLPFWDNLKGFLIILVVLGHFLWGYHENGAFLVRECTYFIYLFHIPAFIFISGFFSHSDKSISLESITRLLVAFLLFNFTIMLYGITIDHKELSLFSIYHASWYLWALILFRTTLPVLIRIPHIIPISVMASLLIGFWTKLDDVLKISSIIAYYPFFIVGAKCSTSGMYLFIDSLKKRKWSVFVFVSLVTLVSLWLIVLGKISFSDIFYTIYTSKQPVLKRLFVLGAASTAIVGLLTACPRTQIPVVNQWGKNSLAIFITHLIFTLVFLLIFPVAMLQPIYWLWMLLAAVILLFILGSNRASSLIEKTLAFFTDSLFHREKFKNRRVQKAAGMLIPLLLLFILSLHGIPSKYADKFKGIFHFGSNSIEKIDPIYTVIGNHQQQLLDKAVRLSFVGDLILLRPQVDDAYNVESGKYDFSSLFQYTEKYFKEADLAMGIFEGPMAGGGEYSTSAFDDGIPLRLNFPDSFAEAVKKAGINYVTTANNHFLDCGTAGATRTLDVLDKTGLLHSGSYRNAIEKEKNHVFLINVRGLKLALLTYTYGHNRHKLSFFLDSRNAYITSVLASPDSKHFKTVRQNVLNDFAKARAMRPDCIIVLPHMGTSFQHSPDSFQRVWTDIFVKAGADIILSDHSHAVQPVEWQNRPNNEGKSLIVHCPGNYVNSYTEKDGDASAIVEAYLDSRTGKPFAAANIPLWGQSPAQGNYQPLPIYDILHDPALQRNMSTYDMERVRQVHSLVTSVMLGHDLSLDQVQNRYYLFPEGYLRNKVKPLEISDAMKATQLYRLLKQAQTVCFVGDSVTAGSKNGGYGWYEPMTAAFPHLTVYKRAWGSHTSKMLLKKLPLVTNTDADLYVIAIGANDVRYRDKKRCAMTAKEYIENIQQLVKGIRQKSPGACFVFIGAWSSDHYDPVSLLGEQEQVQMLKEYREALHAWAQERGYLYIDPNPQLEATFRTKYIRRWLKDHIHPNAAEGIRLYSQKVLECSP